MCITVTHTTTLTITITFTIAVTLTSTFITTIAVIMLLTILQFSPRLGSPNFAQGEERRGSCGDGTGQAHGEPDAA